MRFLGLRQFLLLGLLVAANVGAQDRAPTLKILNLSTKTDGEVEVLASVVDASGVAVRGLTGSNFRVKLDDHEQESFRFRMAGSDKPISVVLAIDTSASMKGEAARASDAAARAFVAALQPPDFCAVVAFGNTVRVVQEFTNDHGLLTRALSSLEPSDTKTLLYQAVFESFDVIGTAPTARGAVVLVTDGKDDGSRVSLQDALTKATVRDVPVYAIGFGRATDRQVLQRVAAVSKGVFYDSPRADDLAAAYADIGNHLYSNYALTFRPTPSTAGPKAVTVTLQYRGQEVSATGAISAAQPPPESGPIPASSPTLMIVGLALVSIGIIVAATWFTVRRMRRKIDPVWKSTIKMQNVWLEVVRGADAGTKLMLLEKETVIGRNPDQAHLALKNDPMIGREHARVYLNESDQYVVEDLGSQNGITVNGLRVQQPLILQNQDRIGMGLSELLFIDQR